MERRGFEGLDAAFDLDARNFHAHGIANLR